MVAVLSDSQKNGSAELALLMNYFKTLAVSEIAYFPTSRRKSVCNKRKFNSSVFIKE